MKNNSKYLLQLAVASALVPCLALADPATPQGGWEHDSTVAAVEKAGTKALSARSLASRGTVTAGITMYGGFDPASSGTIFILVRGNSLGTLGVTQGYLDMPRITLYNQQGEVLITSSASCTGGPVGTYYQNVRGAPASPNDACIFNANAAPGPVTFAITPSPGSTRYGEVLFEVTLGP